MDRVSLTTLKLMYFPLEMVVTVYISRILAKIHPLRMMQLSYLLRITMALLVAVYIHILPGRA